MRSLNAGVALIASSSFFATWTAWANPSLFAIVSYLSICAGSSLLSFITLESLVSSRTFCTVSSSFAGPTRFACWALSTHGSHLTGQTKTSFRTGRTDRTDHSYGSVLTYTALLSFLTFVALTSRLPFWAMVSYLACFAFITFITSVASIAYLAMFTKFTLVTGGAFNTWLSIGSLGARITFLTIFTFLSFLSLSSDEAFRASCTSRAHAIFAITRCVDSASGGRAVTLDLSEPVGRLLEGIMGDVGIDRDCSDRLGDLNCSENA